MKSYSPDSQPVTENEEENDDKTEKMDEEEEEKLPFVDQSIKDDANRPREKDGEDLVEEALNAPIRPDQEQFYTPEHSNHAIFLLILFSSMMFTVPLLVMATLYYWVFIGELSYFTDSQQQLSRPLPLATSRGHALLWNCRCWRRYSNRCHLLLYCLERRKRCRGQAESRKKNWMINNFIIMTMVSFFTLLFTGFVNLGLQTVSQCDTASPFHSYFTVSSPVA